MPPTAKPFDRPPEVTVTDGKIAVTGDGFNASYTPFAAAQLIAALEAATAETGARGTVAPSRD
jgi:hypothetical protein